MFEIKIAKNRLKAVMDSNQAGEVAASPMEELSDLLAEHHISFGVKEEVLKQVSENPASVTFPVVIAEGKAPQNGSDAYLRDELKAISGEGTEKFNFRNVLHIPSVKRGQLIATLVPQGRGIDGMDVTGRPVKAKPGRPLGIRAGKNVFQEEGRFYASVDGLLGLTPKAISVNPVFEVKGDLDLKTGNIDFAGTIVIRGNVPSGYALKAGGDIRIHGMVEAAFLEAAGNIIIDGGVAGGMKGKVTAGGNVQANYLNQASVKAEHDVYIKTSILHSMVNAGGNIDCQACKIIGGTLTAGRNIYTRDLGNELFTKTELAVGWNPALEKKEQEKLDALAAVKDTSMKLSAIEAKLTDLANQAGKLTSEQLQLLQKQRATRSELEAQEADLRNELELIDAEKLERQNSSLLALGNVYPNVKVYFGKYAFMTNQMYRKVVFSMDHSEVLVQPAETALKTH